MDTQHLPATSLPAGPHAEAQDAYVSWDAVTEARAPNSHRLYLFGSLDSANARRFPDDAHVHVPGKGSCAVLSSRGCDRAADVFWARLVVNGRMLTGSRRLYAVTQDADGPPARLRHPRPGRRRDHPARRTETDEATHSMADVPRHCGQPMERVDAHGGVLYRCRRCPRVTVGGK